MPDPWQVSPLAQGTNNLVWRVETSAGVYVLRVYRNSADEARLRFEHDLLARVQAMGLPFAVPAPLATRTGELYARAATADGTEDGTALATLTALIPGQQPARENLPQARAGGAALGLLDAALARITPLTADEGTSWRSYGDLAHCHPLVPDPLAAIRALPLAGDVRARLAARYEWLVEHIPGIYAHLPSQLCHEDYSPDNVLMVGDEVSGVLDFEFCARDLRVMDLTVALSWWPLAQFGTGDEWPIIKAVARGYARLIALAPEEIAAMPALFELRAYTSLIHRLGRWRQGLSPLESVTERAYAALEREQWLRTNGGRLMATVAAAAAG